VPGPSPRNSLKPLNYDSPADIRWLRHGLLVWGRNHYRPFPWRTDRDAYRVLVTEVLLKQTRADRIADVRSDILRDYPSPAALAKADPADLAARIDTLGFGRQRSEQLLLLARAINGRPIPTKLALLRELPGIGAYSAAAAACFAYGQKWIALDVNVARILSRVFGVRLERGELRKSPLIKSIGERVVQGPTPRRVNWALLDLGAAVCRPKPRCGECPFQPRCSFAQTALAAKHSR
jgi:A/G-specific adenine glycosylase